MSVTTLGTLHERVGDEGTIRNLNSSSPYGNGAWIRGLGQRTNSSWSGTVNSSATGNLIGLQAGYDLLRTQPYGGGHQDLAGVYFAYADYNAPTVRGFALGIQDFAVGRLQMRGPAVGGYWTHFGPSGWYVDTVFQASWYDISAYSGLGTGLSTNATAYAASIETGYPIHIGGDWQIEPQAQIINQSISVNGSRDALSPVNWDEANAWIGRLGARMQYNGADAFGMLWQPYARVNLWQAFNGTDRVSFGMGAPLDNRFGDTALEVGGGITAQATQNVALYAHAAHRWSVAADRSRQSATRGNIGIRVNW